MFARTNLLIAILITALTGLAGGCIRVKDQVATPKLLKNENANQAQLVNEVQRIAKVTSMRAKVTIKFEDTSYAESGVAEKYKTTPGEIVVQRPSSILFKIQAPVVGTEIAKMASDGRKFEIAILQDGGDGRFKKFLRGTNNADYSLLEAKVDTINLDSSKVIKQQANALKNLRPQHFTDALLVRPLDTQGGFYTTSTIVQEEVDMDLLKSKSPMAWVLRGYYLLDEFTRATDGSLHITRRFWFDRVGGIRVARQQIYDANGEIESDISYGREGALGSDNQYGNLPLKITVTRPKDKYKITLTYSTPENVSLGRSYKQEAFTLLNDDGLEEVDLDEQLSKLKSSQTSNQAPANATKFQ